MKKTQIYDLISSKIKTLIEESNAINPKDTPHPGLRGRFREIQLQNLLELFLPKTCNLIHGTVTDVNGNRKEKTEDDILIVIQINVYG